MFNSIWYALVARQVTSPRGGAELRETVAEAVRANAVDYDDATLGMPRDKYISWILDKEHWGGM